MSLALAEHMANAGIKTVAFIGFSDTYGEGWSNEFSKATELKKFRFVNSERFARNDTSVTGQMLEIMFAKPDAVLPASPVRYQLVGRLPTVPCWRSAQRQAMRG